MIKTQIDICKYVKFHSLNSKLFTSISLMWDSQQYITPICSFVASKIQNPDLWFNTNIESTNK